MPAAVSIPKTLSSPADPNAPSLLNALPEIRNALYHVLFKRDEPVLVHNWKLYHAVEPRVSDPNSLEGYGGYFDALQKLCDEAFEDEIGGDNEFKHQFGEGLSLLLSCRQIYHECVGILYGNNTFVLTRATDRCDIEAVQPHYRPDSMPEEAEYVHLSYVGEWLQNLGTQRKFLSRVCLDVDTLCPLGCDLGWDEFDLLPLLNVLWQYEQCSVTFMRTGRVLDDHPRDAAAEHECDELTKKLNNLLRVLAADDVLRIKRYAPLHRILAGVEIGADFARGEVLYYDSQKVRPDLYRRVYQEFNISEGGVGIQLEERNSGLSFLDLPRGIQRRIYDYMGRASAGITLDLDKHRISGYPIHLLHLCRTIHEKLHLEPDLTRSVSKTVVATSKDLVTDFPTLSVLEKILSPHNQDRIFPAIFHKHDPPAGQPHHLTIGLRLRPTSPALLVHARIDMKRLIPLFKYKCPSNTMLRVHMSFPTAHGTYEDSAQVPLERLFRQFFLVLSDVLDEWPTDTPRSINSDLPTLIMTGRCEVLHASYAATSKIGAMTVANRHHKLTASELLRRGYRMGALLDTTSEYQPMGHSERDYVRSDSVYGLWQKLLKIGWSDLYTVRKPG